MLLFLSSCQRPKLFVMTVCLWSGEAGACLQRSLCERRGRPGQVAGPSQGQMKHNHYYTHTLYNLESPINLIWREEHSSPRLIIQLIPCEFTTHFNFKGQWIVLWKNFYNSFKKFSWHPTQDWLIKSKLSYSRFIYSYLCKYHHLPKWQSQGGVSSSNCLCPACTPMLQ